MIKRKVLNFAAALISSTVFTSFATAQENAAQGSAAVLRALDKVSGRVTDLELPIGASAPVLGLLVTLGDCRYPADNPTGNAYAYLDIRDPQDGIRYFEGWMIATSPALNALDHNRYDIWVLRCRTS